MLLASRARTMLKQPRALQALNRVASGILAGTGRLHRHAGRLK
jgi:threonine/homoserine/homoserine lactone efflux protein